MDTLRTLAIYDAVRASWNDEIPFPQIIGRLADIGVERYHADYSRQEKTFYLADGRSLVTALPLVHQAIAEEFSAAAVEAAVRQSQRREHTYAEFLGKTMAAGCVGYFVQIAGRRAQYFGRRGETHVEPFPPSPPGA